ncbi:MULTISPECIES: hypothetical protein [Streptomyces]|uniref:Uncharacterized protein n=1 Tax=Streptomyces mordarskii TaxID=1226758 RepID=A0ABN1DX50_9ACTN
MKNTTFLRPDAASTPRRSPAPMPGRLPVSDTTARTSRSLYAEARRYESWARNVVDGHTNSTDSNGRVWTLDEIHAHVWECRKAGNEAERAENAPTAAGQVHASVTEAFIRLVTLLDRRTTAPARFDVLVRDRVTGREHALPVTEDMAVALLDAASAEVTAVRPMAEHSRAADTAPTAARPALKALPGGAGR